MFWRRRVPTHLSSAAGWILRDVRRSKHESPQEASLTFSIGLTTFARLTRSLADDVWLASEGR